MQAKEGLPTKLAPIIDRYVVGRQMYKNFTVSPNRPAKPMPLLSCHALPDKLVFTVS